MAETKKTATKTGASKAPSKAKRATKKTPVSTKEATEKPVAEKKAPVRKRRVRINKDEEFILKKGTAGPLYFRSRDGLLEIELNDNNDEFVVTYEDLQKIRRQSKRYFENNWIYIEDGEEHTADEVYCALHVDQYYKTIDYANGETVDYLFDLSPELMVKKINTMPKALRETVATRAKELIDAGEIDSYKTVNALSSCLGVEFD